MKSNFSNIDIFWLRYDYSMDELRISLGDNSTIKTDSWEKTDAS